MEPTENTNVYSVLGAMSITNLKKSEFLYINIYLIQCNKLLLATRILKMELTEKLTHECNLGF